uniref:BAG family molecular chaperone regulator 1 n=1 Tax=Pristionchus pacificus TaxID=54126 RepID=A0A8R1YA75_PRIPA
MRGMKWNREDSERIFRMKIKVAYGTNNVDLDLAAEGGPSTLRELKDRICDELNMDNKLLRIIHRGRTLAGDDADALDKFSFKEGDKLLVIGKTRAPLMSDATFHSLVDFEKKTLVGWQNGYNDLEKDLVELEKRFLEPKQHVEMIKRLEKKMKMFNEAGSRHMISLDAMSMTTEGATEEQVKRNREKRKELINGIETLLNQNDASLRRLEELERKEAEGEKAK